MLRGFDDISETIWDTAALNGKYKLQVRLREVGNESVTVKDSTTVTVNSLTALTNVSLGSDAIGAQMDRAI